MPCFYLKPKKDDSNKIPELQVRIAEALYDVESVMADPGAYTAEDHCTDMLYTTVGSTRVSQRRETWDRGLRQTRQQKSGMVRDKQEDSYDWENCGS